MTPDGQDDRLREAKTPLGPGRLPIIASMNLALRN